MFVSSFVFINLLVVDTLTLSGVLCLHQLEHSGWPSKSDNCRSRTFYFICLFVVVIFHFCSIAFLETSLYSSILFVWLNLLRSSHLYDSTRKRKLRASIVAISTSSKAQSRPPVPQKGVGHNNMMSKKWLQNRSGCTPMWLYF